MKAMRERPLDLSVACAGAKCNNNDNSRCQITVCSLDSDAERKLEIETDTQGSPDKSRGEDSISSIMSSVNRGQKQTEHNGIHNADGKVSERMLLPDFQADVEEAQQGCDDSISVATTDARYLPDTTQRNSNDNPKCQVTVDHDLDSVCSLNSDTEHEAEIEGDEQGLQFSLMAPDRLTAWTSPLRLRADEDGSLKRCDNGMWSSTANAICSEDSLHYNGSSRIEFTVGFEVDKLGVSFSSLAPDTVRVKTVLHGSWADKEGIQIGDTILEVNNVKTGEMTREEFMKAMGERPLGLKVACAGAQINRNDNSRCQITVGLEVEKLGFSFSSLAPDTVRVKTVLNESWADKKGIQINDIILEVNNIKTRDMTREEFMKAMHERPLGLKVAYAVAQCNSNDNPRCQIAVEQYLHSVCSSDSDTERELKMEVGTQGLPDLVGERTLLPELWADDEAILPGESAAVCIACHGTGLLLENECPLCNGDGVFKS